MRLRSSRGARRGQAEGPWAPWGEGAEATDRAALLCPSTAGGRGLLGQLQEVVQHHLAVVVPGEAVKVIDAEVQFALCQLSQRHGELKRLVEDGVQGLPVHLQGRARRPTPCPPAPPRSDPGSGTPPLPPWDPDIQPSTPDLGLKLLLAVRQQVDLDVGI